MKMNANVFKKNANDLAAAGLRSQKSDEQKGAVEGDHRLDKGLPKSKKAIAEDSLGAQADETQG
jgi:hypothetical protein